MTVNENPRAAPLAETATNAPRRNALFYCGLLLALALDVTVTWVHPGADSPSQYSNDFSQLADGYWYLAEAKSWVTGEPLHVDAEYRLPMISYPAYAIYSIAGVSIPASRALSSLASLLTITLLAFLLRRRFGAMLAVAGALLLALDPAWHAYVRSPVIYPWVTFWMLAVLALASGAGWLRWSCGAALAVALGFLLKSIIWFALPAILWEGWRRFRATPLGARRSSWILPLAGCAAAGGIVAAFFIQRYWPRVELYLGLDSGWPFTKLWRFEDRAQLFSALSQILPLAWISLVVHSGLLFKRRPLLTAFERVSLATCWGTLLLFSVCEYTPFRYLLVVEPILIWGALALVATLFRIGSGSILGSAARPEFGEWRPAGVLLALLGSVYIATECILAARASNLPFTGLGLIAMLPLLWFAWRTIAAGRALASAAPLLRGAFAFVCAIALALPAGPRLYEILAENDDALVRANRQIAAILPANAILFGEFAHALAVENALAPRSVFSLRFGNGALKEGLRKVGCTHILRADETSERMIAIFEQDGVQLEEIDQYYVQKHLIRLYRLKDVSLSRSLFEQGLECARAADFDGAERAFSKVIAAAPFSPAAWVRYGQVLLERRNPDKAFRCFEEALKQEKHCHAAHLALGRLFAGGGYQSEAALHLRAAMAQAPENSGYRELLNELHGAPKKP